MQDKTVYLFNKFFSSFLKDLKSSHPELRTAVKENYKVVDKKSPDYITFFTEQWGDKVALLLEGEDASQAQVCKGIDMALVVKCLEKQEEDLNLFWNYMYILGALMVVYREAEEALLEQVVKVLGLLQSEVQGRGEAADGALVKGEIHDILEDDVRELLLRAVVTTAKIPAPETAASAARAGGATEDFGNLFAGLENSKIASLAKEISKDIDMSALAAAGDNPQDILKNLMDFGSGSGSGGNILGNIVQKVTSTLGQKISSGEIKQEDLMSEAMSMMSLMNPASNPLMAQFANNPMVAEMMKGMKSGRATPRTDVMKKASTRDRLRKKLDEKKNNM